MHRETLAVVDGILGVEAEAHGPPVSTAGRMDLRGSNGTIAPREQLAEALGELAAQDAGWAAALLAAPPEVRLGGEARRFGAALGLSAAYGVALGLRGGARGMALEAAVIPAAWIAVAGLGVPALAILLALADAPVRAVDLACAASRAAARAGLVLLGLAPPIALFAVTTDEASSGVLLGGVGLAVAWAFALRAFAGEVARRTDARSLAGRGAALAATLGFAVFATALVGRIWLYGLAPLWGAP